VVAAAGTAEIAADEAAEELTADVGATLVEAAEDWAAVCWATAEDAWVVTGADEEAAVVADVADVAGVPQAASATVAKVPAQVTRKPRRLTRMAAIVDQCPFSERL